MRIQKTSPKLPDTHRALEQARCTSRASSRADNTDKGSSARRGESVSRGLSPGARALFNFPRRAQVTPLLLASPRENGNPLARGALGDCLLAGFCSRTGSRRVALFLPPPPSSALDIITSTEVLALWLRGWCFACESAFFQIWWLCENREIFTRSSCVFCKFPAKLNNSNSAISRIIEARVILCRTLKSTMP